MRQPKFRLILTPDWGGPPLMTQALGFTTATHFAAALRRQTAHRVDVELRVDTRTERSCQAASKKPAANDSGDLQVSCPCGMHGKLKLFLAPQAIAEATPAKGPSSKVQIAPGATVTFGGKFVGIAEGPVTVTHPGDAVAELTTSLTPKSFDTPTPKPSLWAKLARLFRTKSR